MLKYFIPIITFFLIRPFSLEAQVNLNFETELNEETNQYCTQIMVCAHKEDVLIGTSSFFIEYNDQALQFQSYKALGFHNENECYSGMKPYGPQYIDSNSKGVISISIELRDPETVCPKLEDIPTPIAEICFDITNKTETSKLRFNEKYTSINKAKQNFQTYELIDIESTDEPLNTNITSNKTR